MDQHAKVDMLRISREDRLLDAWSIISRMRPRALPSDAFFMLGGSIASLLGALRLGWILGGEGRTRPDSKVPYVLLLRPFRSASRDFLSHLWVGPALWQFGQPVFPVDSNCAIWREKSGYAVPKESAWKRNLFGFDRVMNDKSWLKDISGLVEDSGLVVVDVSIITESIEDELSVIEANSALGRTICIVDRNSDPSKRCLKSSASEGVASAVRSAISYSWKDAAELTHFWRVIVERASTIVGWSPAELPHPVPPKRFSLDTKYLLPVIRSGSLAAARRPRIQNKTSG